MFNYKKHTNLLIKSIILGLGLTLAACGGGSGGGNTGPTGITYTGKTNSADVDDTNTQTYAAAIIDGSQDSQENLSQLGLTVVASNDSTAQQNKQHVMMNMLVEKIKSDIEKTTSNGNSLISGAIPPSNGNCGGTSSITGSNTATGFEYSINYSNHCTSFNGISVTLSGDLTVSGQHYPSSTTIKSMSISFSRFTMVFVDSNNSNATYTNEFSGTIATNFTANGALESMTVSVNFIENGKVYQISNMSFTTSGTDVSISGTIYHPDYGYVTFETDPTDPFIVFNDQLCGGTLTVTGTNSIFTITADATCQSYTYSGTNANSVNFSGSFTTL